MNTGFPTTLQISTHEPHGGAWRIQEGDHSLDANMSFAPGLPYGTLRIATPTWTYTTNHTDDIREPFRYCGMITIMNAVFVPLHDGATCPECLTTPQS